MAGKNKINFRYTFIIILAVVLFLSFCFSLGRILIIKSRFSTMLFEISASVAYANEHASLVADSGDRNNVNMTSENAANIYNMIVTGGPTAWGSKRNTGAQTIVFSFGNDTSLELYQNGKGSTVLHYEGVKHNYTFVLGTSAKFANALLFASEARNPSE